MPFIPVSEATPGMWITEDVFAPNGKKLVKKGTQLTNRHIDHFRQYSVTHIHVAEPSEETVSEQRMDLSGHDVYRTTVLREAKTSLNLALHRMINMEYSRHTKRIEEIGSRLIDDPEILEYLLKIRAVGNGSLRHAIRVMALSLAVGIQMNIDKVTLEQLGTAALLYDIGMCYVDRSILMKPGSLTTEEYNIVKEHVQIGYRILKQEFDEVVSLVALQHHERYDGSGYPQGLTNESIHLFSRIVAVSDVFLSLISPRVYRYMFPPHEAMEYLFGSGGLLFDPNVVKAFLKVVSLYTVGTVVELNNGWVGVVKEVVNKPLGRPVVEIVMDEHRQAISKIVDLSTEYQLTIERVLE